MTRMSNDEIVAQTSKSALPQVSQPALEMKLLAESPRRGDFGRLGEPSLPSRELAPSKADLRPVVFFPLKSSFVIGKLRYAFAVRTEV